jgi:type IV secretory pathway TrbL component
MINATVVSQPITASVSGSGVVTASVASSVVSASASGGIGPQGPAGTASAGLGDLTSVNLSSVQNGDVLQYNGTKWVNVPQTQLVDGGNA